MINRVKVEVNSSAYIIATPEDEGYVVGLGKELDTQVRQVMDSSNRITQNDALVLCALNYMDAYYKSEQSADHMRAQLTDYLEDAARARLELDEARREIERLGRRLELLGQSQV